jgi:hypothetical protein
MRYLILQGHQEQFRSSVSTTSRTTPQESVSEKHDDDENEMRVMSKPPNLNGSCFVEVVLC